MEEESDASRDDFPEAFTEEQRRELGRAVDQRRQRQTLAGQVFGGVLIALVGGAVSFRVDPGYWVPAVGIVALAALAFRLTNWKCPACGEGLPTRRSRKVCLGCGLPLD